ncbi:uncharacterized protein QC764_704390 [Podospora pseudoanserina]|uniref:Protein kinase domain-containing protein n=1 Tax=Podospora pseudoanserina TaxID=2609844 RepID=A0ABR0HIP4_9PEZI|nr:hypothetical protein QC764_704390 [Podospora pseudoanserina]
MDPLNPMGDAQPAFQRRLSRLYNDTKRRSEFVQTSVQHPEADPEVRSLHRRLRIQKDRFVTWGLEWADPSQSAEVLIDSSLNKAGISELVSNIMSNIKEILAEAEPLWMSSRRLAGEIVEPAQPPRRGEKIQMVVWDKSKFEGLIRDLTDAIDTLYEVSRTRSSYASSAAVGGRPAKSSAAAEDLRPFASSRLQTPEQIDPKILTSLRSVQAAPMTEHDEKEKTHEIVFMDKQSYAKLTRTTAGARHTQSPLLLEYAPFSSLYSITGVSPPMHRFEKLFSGLQLEPQRPVQPGSWIGLPRLLGYFEDMENSRFGLIYQFPQKFNAVTFETLTQNPLNNLCTLADLLARPDFEPRLEAKFRLAANLANSVFDLHDRGITHGSIGDENISFCNAVGTDPEVSGITQGEVDIRRPLISSFDLFSETEPEYQEGPREFSLYKHPLDPRNSVQSPLTNNADSKTFDLYSLAMILLSIGLWTKLENLVPNMASPVLPESVLTQLGIRCGTLYMKAVQTLWSAVDQELSGTQTTDKIVERVEFKAGRYLEACCILDGVSNLEERLGDDLGDVRPEHARLNTPSIAGPSKDSQSEKPSASVLSAGQVQTEAKAADANETSTKPKLRLFKHVPLPPEEVERWNTNIMPQVNQALRHFYRKNPESVEISLESVGESPQKTKPTVLVVCQSTSLVKTILKKRLGNILAAAGLGLRVCTGRVIKSRRDAVGRSMAGPEEEVVAANPEHQQQPLNGASIGAWNQSHHLPPVSLGGMLTVDGRLYGMTVHHMLDEPGPDSGGKSGAPRSMAGPPGMTDLHAWYAQQYTNPSDSDQDTSSSSEYDAYDLSDADSDAFSESAITSDYSEEDNDDDGEYQESEPGDIPGIEPGCGDGYIVTQPALDDVDAGFYPCLETQDEDHLDTYRVGEMYASSGIRRRREGGMNHEIDWALFEFFGERLPSGNLIPSLDPPPTKAQSQTTSSSICPTTVAPMSSLPGLGVQCMARTSGLQTGVILPAMVSVKIYGRVSPSETYQVSGTRPSPDQPRHPKQSSLPMGMPGDSGAWVVDGANGRVCGHILAWSERKKVAYICPMDVLILDIAETLEANEIRLPGGEVVYSREPLSAQYPMRSLTQRSARSDMSGWQRSEGDVGDDEGEEPSTPMARFAVRRHSSRRSQRSVVAGKRASYLSAKRQSQQATMESTVGEEELEHDEGVEVDISVGLANQLKAMNLPPGDSSLSSSEMMRKWGYA